MPRKKEPSLIHLRFARPSAIEGKKDILNSQIDLLKISQHITKYRKLRKTELLKKEQVQSKIKSARRDLTKLHRLLPEIKIPKILVKKEEKINKTVSETVPEEFSKYGTIEDQLKQIQRKLKALEMSQGL